MLIKDADSARLFRDFVTAVVAHGFVTADRVRFTGY